MFGRTYGKSSSGYGGVSYGSATTADMFNESIVRETFTVVDTDQKGKVSVHELRDGLKAMGQRFSDASLERMLQRLGLQNSAEVS